MLVTNEIATLNDTLDTYRFQKKSIGLVPTMGALHAGHIELVRNARQECDVVISTIYINPTQFNNKEDLEKYPRTLDNDLKILKNEGCDIVFNPTDEVMYPNNHVTFNFGEICNVLEGGFRPGHFNGVGLIVSKFFNIVRPNLAYFGQKDLQQFAIISLLVNDLNYQIKLKRVPTVRSQSGLALSSRNSRLSEEGINNALVLNKMLSEAKKKLIANENVLTVAREVRDYHKNPNVQIEYFEIVNKNTFERVNEIEYPNDIAICIAGYVEGVRLIDNMLLTC